MKSFRKVLNINAPHRRDYFNITGEVEAALKESGISEGICLVNAMRLSPPVWFIKCD